jgi:hypothetical protein
MELWAVLSLLFCFCYFPLGHDQSLMIVSALLDVYIPFTKGLDLEHLLYS